MPRSYQLALALGLSVILSAPVLAQRPGGPGQGGPGRPGGMRGMQGGLVQILSMPPVVDELELSEEQTSKVRTIADQFREELMGRMRETREALADLGPEARRDRFEEMTRTLDESAQERLQEVLEPEQMTRLRQIQLQLQGVQAFANPRVKESLKLDDEQQSKLSELIEAYRSETQSLMADAREADQRGQVMRDLMELRRETLDKAMSILTDEQKSSWDELTGETFQMGPGAGGRRGGFGPGGRPGPGGRRGPGGPPSAR
ncbi:Spy/CpxP family protein refolding chaperone [Tautonia sp. JC769]|uniref:Spy/CpxP family protein refolding chaperone n=1 Tax=Tautonia sp. JC769 TaxID=3232135 RepID=UPI003459ABAA